MMTRTLKNVGLAIATLLVGGAAWAGPCEKHYTAVGVPLVTPIVFSSWAEFEGLAPDRALKRMARSVRSEGFAGIKVDAARRTITAYQETSGSGRAQTLTVTAKPTQNGTRVAIAFKIRAGQVANDRDVRPGMCKILNAAAG